MNHQENIDSLKNMIRQIRNELSFLGSGRVSSWDDEMRKWFQDELKDIQEELENLRKVI